MIGRDGGEWRELFRKLGSAVLELIGVEIEALVEDVSKSGRQLAIALGYFAAAAAAGFWFVGVLTAALITFLSRWLPVWGAVVAVAAILLVVIVVLAAIGWWWFRRVELPTETVARRWADHRDWWETRMLPGEDDGRAERERPHGRSRTSGYKTSS